ncbi:MAG: ABC transporter ATP-binding protein [Candidatus Latescibacterota bacterium]
MLVEARDVAKKYPGKWALDGVTFSADQGKVLGVLGENGAGKSTLFRIISGITRPTRGTVAIAGMPVSLETRKIVAYLPDINPFYEWMRVMEQMEFLASFYPEWDMNKTSELLAFLDVSPNDRIGELSRGQQAKLKMVYAFSWPSRLVLMDEPLGGIDPPTRKKVISTLFHEFRYGEQGIFICTHLVSEVEEFIEDVLYMKKGKIVLSDQADLLREKKGKSLTGIFEEIAEGRMRDEG